MDTLAGMKSANLHHRPSSISSSGRMTNFGRTLRMGRKLWNCWTGVLILGIFAILFLFTQYNARTVIVDFKELPFGPSELADLKALETNLEAATANKTKLDLIAEFIHRRLDYLQTNASCSSTIFCGHDNACGLGCQLHHRNLCVAMSFLLNMPLVHNHHKWPYHDAWETVFQPLGSQCSESDVKYNIQWDKRPICPFISVKNSSDWLSSPVTILEGGSVLTVTKGLPMPSLIRETLYKIHPSPFVWLVGLFTNYTMKLEPQFEREYWKWKSSFTTPNIIGAHIRRTDKYKEANDSVHQVSEYADQALRLHQQVLNGSKPITLYAATDDSKVLKEFQTKYKAPDWRVIGETGDTTLQLKTRNSGLKTVVRDILMLTDSNSLICGLSSNICRLVFELKTYRGDWDPDKQFKSMDREHGYGYETLCARMPTEIT